MLNNLSLAAADPIISLMSVFAQDERDNKIDLGIGLYRDEHGKTPVMRAIKTAEERLVNAQESKAYIGSRGDSRFLEHMERLLFGEEIMASTAGRMVSVQTAGCASALRVLFELVSRANPAARVWVSDPSWPYHVPCARNAGLATSNFRYYHAPTGTVDFTAMLEDLQALAAGDVLLLQAVCHNPTGADMNPQQLSQIAELCVQRGVIALVDASYMGFGSPLEADLSPLRSLIGQLPEVMVACSCSKIFGVYRDRLGCATVITQSDRAANATMSQLLSVVRAIYSMPPDHPAAVVGALLSDDELRRDWESELLDMRTRLRQMRLELSEALLAHGFDAAGARAIEQQRGVFSMLNLGEEKVQQLREQHALYLVGSGRVNIAGLTSDVVPDVAQRMVAVM